METTDPYTNTTTVKNILQHIVVPKIVSDGSSGYVTKTDLTNIHNLIFVNHSTTTGSLSAKNTGQTGAVSTNSQSTIVYHSRVTSNSVIIACINSSIPNYPMVSYVNSSSGQFEIFLDRIPDTNVTVGWFIVHF